jgi:transposase-like protein
MAGTAPRTSHQSRLDWWRATLQRQHQGNLSVTEFCRRLGVAVSTFYRWKNLVQNASPNAPGPRHDVHHRSRASSAVGTTSANFVPVSILAATGDAFLEVELGNACVVRLRGSVDPSLLHAAITAAGQLDGDRQGAN